MRRREQRRDVEARPEAPVWIRQIYAGLKHFGDGRTFEIGGEASSKFRAARDEWCRTQGCWRQGKTCIEVCGRPCDAAARKARP